jgi:hypothetical protein
MMAACFTDVGERSLPEAVTFGRRQPRTVRPAPAPAHAPQSTELSAAAEAFRAELAADRRPRGNDFGAWRRSRRWRQALVLAGTVGSFAPGVATFVMDAPLSVSIGLQVAAVVGNVWLRRGRFRRRREILAWEDAGDQT